MIEQEKIILEIIAKNPKTKGDFDRARHKASKKLKTTQPSNNELLSAYQKLVKKKSLKLPKAEAEKIEFFLRKANIRTLSGVAIVTSLTESYPCPGNCVYCPVEAKMPKSYLSSEPAAARALGLNFDPYLQMKRRIEMLETNGHPTDKIEFIVKGGTWNYYPLEYQYWFILRSFVAANGSKSKKTRPLPSLPYEGRVRVGLIKELQKQLEIEQKKNEKSKHRIVGLTLETRPDYVTPETILHMREMGCTRIELGLQATDNKILKLTKRGHTVEQFKDAMLLLRQAGFKVDLHFMPGLPGSTAKHDVEMYKQLFSDPGLKPDMVKIYPCTVIKNSELYNWYKEGKYKPYSDKKLLEALIEMKTITPRYCRISRLIRDIPEPDIQAGNKVTNLRQYLAEEMKKRGLKCQCLRCREVGHSSPLLVGEGRVRSGEKLFVDKYSTNGGTEYFLSFEDKKRQVVFAFLRLRLTVIASEAKQSSNTLPRLDCHALRARNDSVAFIRELHTYGQMLGIGEEDSKSSQHKGLGKKLVAEAEKIAKKNKFKKLAVISGVGVRDYYRKLGYKKEGTYMVKKLT